MSLHFQKRVDSSFLVPFLVHREISGSSPRAFHRNHVRRNIADKKCNELAYTFSDCKRGDFIVHNDLICSHNGKGINICDLHSGKEVSFIVEGGVLYQILGKVFEIFQDKLFYCSYNDSRYVTKCLNLYNHSQQYLVEVGESDLLDVKNIFLNNRIMKLYVSKHEIKILEMDGTSNTHILESDSTYKAKIESERLIVAGRYAVCITSHGIHVLNEGDVTTNDIRWEEHGLTVYAAIGKKDFLFLSLGKSEGLSFSTLMIHLPTLDKKSFKMDFMYDRVFLFHDNFISQCAKKINERKRNNSKTFPVLITNLYTGVTTRLFDEYTNSYKLEFCDEQEGLLVLSTEEKLGNSQSVYSCKFFDLKTRTFIGEQKLGEWDSGELPSTIELKEGRLISHQLDSVFIFDYCIQEKIEDEEEIEIIKINL